MTLQCAEKQSRYMPCVYCTLQHHHHGQATKYARAHVTKSNMNGFYDTMPLYMDECARRIMSSS
jgi:hypothetical protein